MAVPCMVNVASSANDDNWRRLERLLCELFVVLRALMVHPTTSPGTSASNNPQPPPSGGPPPNPPRGDGSGPSGGAGSSITVTSRTGQSLTISRGSARRRTPLATPKPPGSTQRSVASWQQLGCELRGIADTLSPAKRQQPKLIQIRRVPAIYEPCGPGEVTKLTSCLTLGVTALSLLRTAWGDAD